MSKNVKIEIRHVKDTDKEFWFSLDKHISNGEFQKKIRDKQGYILTADNRPAGILRYNLFWDNTPFCNLLFIKNEHQRKGYGRKLTEYWENEMKSLGFDWIMISTRSDENAQHFYRAAGYKDCGILNPPGQPAELFLCKFLSDMEL